MLPRGEDLESFTIWTLEKGQIWTKQSGIVVSISWGTPVSIAIERETFHEMKWGGREKYPAVGQRGSRCRLRRVVLSWQYFSLHCVFSLWVWAAPASPDRRWMAAAAALTPLGTNASTLRYWWHGITTEQAAGMQLLGVQNYLHGALPPRH